ncbi:MAG: YraN family protein [bacterium]
MSRKSIGKQGECLALQYLKEKGYQLVGKNVRMGRFEIDIIAKQNQTLVFFEVKTRAMDSWDSNFTSWSYAQQKRFLFAVKRYLTDNNLWNKFDIRLDFIAINSGNWSIEHIENALTDCR